MISDYQNLSSDETLAAKIIGNHGDNKAVASAFYSVYLSGRWVGKTREWIGRPPYRMLIYLADTNRLSDCRGEGSQSGGRTGKDDEIGPSFPPPDDSRPAKEISSTMFKPFLPF